MKTMKANIEILIELGRELSRLNKIENGTESCLQTIELKNYNYSLYYAQDNDFISVRIIPKLSRQLVHISYHTPPTIEIDDTNLFFTKGFIEDFVKKVEEDVLQFEFSREENIFGINLPQEIQYEDFFSLVP